VDFVSMPCYAHSFGGLGGPSVQSNAGIGIAFDLRCVTSKSCCSNFAAGASFHFQAFARFFPKGGLFRLSSTQTTQNAGPDQVEVRWAVKSAEIVQREQAASGTLPSQRVQLFLKFKS
jgi:hypothetical protein